MHGANEARESSSERVTTPPESSVTSGIGYAYNIPPVTVMPHQNTIPQPWSTYAPGSQAPLHFSTDSNDSEGFLSQMASQYIPPPGQHGHTPGSFGGFGGASTKAEPCPEIDTRAASPPPARERFSYTRYQVELLNGIFMKIRYPNSMQKQLIAKRVGIKRDQVKIWFQNRRRKDVVGKTTAKDDDSERKMVKDDVLDCVVKELESYTDDPKGRKIKEAVRFSERKGKRRSTRSSPPKSDDDNQSKSPIHIAPVLENVISEHYQPNCMSFPIHSTPPGLLALSEPTPGMIDMTIPPNTAQSKSSLITTNALPTTYMPLTQAPVIPGASPVGKDMSKSDSLINSVLESVPIPIIGQSTAKPVENNTDHLDKGISAKTENKDNEDVKDIEKVKILTELTPIDESSNDSQFSTVSVASPLSGESSVSSLHDSSGSRNNGQIDLSTQAPNNICNTSDANTSSGSLKRPRSDDSDEEIEPPKKRQEVLPENADGIVPPNKVAPPSEPLKFDFSLIKPQVNNQMPLTMLSNGVQDQDNRPTSPKLIAPPQPWSAWTNRPGIPNPGIASTPEGNIGQFNPYMPPMPLPNPHFKSPCGPELPWPPLRDLYPLPPSFHQPPWDLQLTETGLDPKLSTIGEQNLNCFLPPDPLKMMAYNGQAEDGARSGQMAIHRPEPIHSWMLPSYPNPFNNFGPPSFSGGGDKSLKV